MNLCEIPTELLVRIFCILDGADITRLSQVCTLFRDTVLQSTVLQYHVGLAMCGYRDISTWPEADGRTKTSAECLAMIQAHEQAWVCFSPQACVPLELSPQRPFMEATNMTLYGEYLCAISHIGELAILRVYQLQSPFTSHYQNGWCVELDGPRKFTNYVVDPSQNLLVILLGLLSDPDPSLEIRRLSDGQVHPLAAVPSLNVSDALMSHTTFTRDLRVTGDIVVILFSSLFPDMSGIIVFNWMTGEKVGSMSFRDSQIGTIYMHVLSPTTILIAKDNDLRLDVFSVPGSHSPLSDDVQDRPLSLIGSYLLPELADGVSVLEIGWKRIPTWSAVYSRPFLQHVIGVHCHFRTSTGSPFVGELFVDVSNFVTSPIAADCEPLIFEWERWGPNATRMVDCTDRGSVIIYSDNLAYYTPGGSSVILDFTQHRLNSRVDVRDDNPLPDTISTIRTVTEETVIRKLDIFASEVVSRLRYREIQPPVAFWPKTMYRMLVNSQVIVRATGAVSAGAKRVGLEVDVMTM